MPGSERAALDYARKIEAATERTDQEGSGDVDDENAPGEVHPEDFVRADRHQVSGYGAYRTANGDRDDELQVHRRSRRVAVDNSKPPAIKPAINVAATR
jgi:hypothetical protein